METFTITLRFENTNVPNGLQFYINLTEHLMTFIEDITNSLCIDILDYSIDNTYFTKFTFSFLLQDQDQNMSMTT